MEKAKLENFKSLFISMLNDLAFDERELSTGLGVGDEVDRSMEERSALLDFKLQGRKRFLLVKIQEALFRIANGSFGECIDCGEEIGEARLKARPMATKCVRCKEEEEREEEQIDYAKRSHTLGQSLSNNDSNPIFGAGELSVVTQQKKRSLSKMELGVTNLIEE